MKKYRTKSKRLSGTRYAEVYDKAYGTYIKIKKRTKRRPYIRSSYFKNQKVFLTIFWQHLNEKNWRDRTKRLRYLPAAIETIRHSRFDPISKNNPNKQVEIFHRFLGTTSDNYSFVVQIKENKRTGQKWLLSVFPKN